MIQQDIGTYPFYKYLKENTPENNKEKYFEIIRHLIRMQNCASEDFRKIFPQRKFDKNIYLWETAYFREMVLDRYLETDYDCSQLNSDFEKIALYLDECDEYFMHRDFQSTNIFIHNNKIYFIDYQTAFYGNNLYDAASLIYDPYTEIDFREELTEYYKKNFYKNFTEKNFENKMLYTKAQRLMQACAAYVKLGLIDDKKFFVKFIDKTLNELYYLFNDKNFDKIYLKKISENFIKKNGEKICAE
jgi:aminoglycoside/choline kinase family phosphotransferase